MSYDFKGKYVFLSGPVTGHCAWNRPAFDEAAEWLISQGAAYVYTPVGLSPRDGEEPHPHERYMLRTLHELTGPHFATPFYDAIALLPGWQDSEGAKVEKAVAEAIGLDVVELEGLL